MNDVIDNFIRKPGGALALALALAFGMPPWASAGAADAPPAKTVCLDINRIDHTEVLNDHQILFYMLGHKVWINNLPARCPDLTRDDGFVWDSSIERYCDNLETIRVLRTGDVCLLGAFTPYEKPHAS